MLTFFHLDWLLLLGLLALVGFGCIALYSAARDGTILWEKQLVHFAIGFIGLFICAQISPEKYRLWTPWLFAVSLGLLLFVLIFGYASKGAQRWINLGVIRFQPSELLKLTVPLMVAYMLARGVLPPTFKQLIITSIILLVPVFLIAKQPDLGTALLVLVSGCSIIFLAGLSWRWIVSIGGISVIILPVIWMLMHNYQRQRVLTFLNPEADPLGSGYHIIQSKIAIGSGGLFGKGWFNGTQSQLQFLPEHTTDFIFSVIGEETGLLGCGLLLFIYLLVIARVLFLSGHTHSMFNRLAIGGLIISFFFAMFVNVGMVAGVLPVVGIPLPLVSYGGSSIITTLIGFGIILSLSTHKRFLAR